jgi:hypothetical protein
VSTIDNTLRRLALPESQLANDDLLFKKIVPALLNISNIS